MSGYLQGDEVSYRRYFRLSRRQFGILHDAIRTYPLWETQSDAQRTPAQRRRDQRRRLALAHASSQFRVATCLYVYAHGGPLIHASGVASIGEQTVRDWLRWFARAVIMVFGPVYMPRTPPSPAVLRSIRSEFASRQGIPNVAMAVNGTHVPYFPRIAEYAADFVNYKGWKSLLVVAFVNSFHLFTLAELGAPGRAGDNGVLRTSAVLDMVRENRAEWLGPDGVVAGDGGASDGDVIFLNPYHMPRTPEKLHFNFCHSSTRFFVEEVFGRWKNRFRFLIDPCHMNHAATNMMIYTSMILYNFITVERRREEHTGISIETAMTTRDEAHHALTRFDGSDYSWRTFYAQFASETCPACAARNSRHCTHMAAYRNQHELDVARTPMQARLRGAYRPSEMRDQICEQLWRRLTMSARQGFEDDLASSSGQPETSAAAEARAQMQEMQDRADRAAAARE